MTVGGDLTVNGTTTTVNSTTVTIDDPIFTLGGDAAPSSNDGKDRGIEFRYYDGAARIGFMGWDNDQGVFTLLSAATNSSEDFSGTAADLVIGGLTTTSITLGGTEITSTAAELNILDGVTATASEINLLDGVTATTAELNILDGVTATTAELNILDGVTATASELNILDGGTSATSTTIVDADRLVLNDDGIMLQVAVTDLATYLSDEITAMPNLVQTGDLDSGSITSGFGAINNGSSAITTTGTVTFGNLSDTAITITAFVDEDDMTSDSATLIPTQQSVKAYVDSQVSSGGAGNTHQNSITAVTADAITVGSILAINSNGVTTASSTDKEIVGVAKSAKSANTAGSVNVHTASGQIVSGVTVESSLSPAVALGDVLYLSGSEDGKVTNVIPTSGIVYRLGYATGNPDNDQVSMLWLPQFIADLG